MRRVAIVLFSLLLCGRVSAQTELVASKLLVPAKFHDLFIGDHTVWLPPGFRISVFAAGALSGTRFMQFDNKGRLCVALTDYSTVVALPDTNHDGIADTAISIAGRTGNAQSIAFHDSALYVANEGQVLRYAGHDAIGRYQTLKVFIDSIPHTVQENGPNHISRTILFDDFHHKIFLSVGSPCNACREIDTDRAAIWLLDQDGSHKEIYASGLRNAVGLAIDSSHTLWATVAERNSQSPDVPGELITHIVPGGFYGWPFAYGDHIYDDFSATPEYTALLPLTPSDSQKVAQMQVADATIAAHSTPLGIAYHWKGNLPTTYDNAFFVASHGSYNGSDGRIVANGSKIIVVTEQGGMWIPQDFAIGFLTDSIGYKRWARPAGIILDTAGNIYFSSDASDSTDVQAIYRISYDPDYSVKQEPAIPVSISESNGLLRIQAQDIESVAIVNVLGRSVMSDVTAQGDLREISVNDLAPGIYFAVIRTSQGTTVRKFIR